MDVTVDRERCLASGMCTLTAPEVFDQDDEGLVLLLDPSPPSRLHPETDEAVWVCPAGAITVTE